MLPTIRCRSGKNRGSGLATWRAAGAGARGGVGAGWGVVFGWWASPFRGGRGGAESPPPLSMAAVRFLVAGPILLLASSRAARPTWLQWRNAAILGAFFFL